MVCINGLSYNAEQSKPCGWDLTRSEAHCQDSWGRFPPWWQAGAANKAAACEWFIGNGFHILDQDSVMRFAGGRDDAGVYTGVRIPDKPSFDERFYLQGRSGATNAPDRARRWATSRERTTTTRSSRRMRRGTRSWRRAISRSPRPTPPTIPAQARVPGRLQRARADVPLGQSSVLLGGRWDFDGGFARETAWFLGAYDNQFTLTGANVGTNQFEHQDGQSVPGNTITQESSSTGYSTSTSFSIGIFDTSGTTTYGRSESEDATITIDISSWKVSPALVGRRITYNWRTNTPVSWDDTISKGTAGPHDLNPMNITDFGPSSITSWSGDPTWGRVSLGVNRVVHLFDHSSYYDRGSNSIVDGGYHDTQLHYVDGPDDRVPNTKSAIGAGINFCDPLVMWAEQFWAQCAGLRATISVTAVCSQSWTTISFEVGTLRTPNSSCNQPSDPVPVGTGNDVDVELLTPSFATVGSTTCTDQNGTVVAQKDSGATITIPGSALKPQTQVACRVNLST